MRIRRGDIVYIRSGADKGKTGKVLNLNFKKQAIIIEGINMRKKHQRPTQKNRKGGIITIEGPINISNIGLFNPALSGPTKISSREITEGGKTKRIRICKKTGEEI
ncbi:MAG: 50S ribosomal protein L24 [candidate division Zixibacteria bacterium]|nr:50S ribosomal protein L24 [candidate division Zixibacteria bacterium]